MGDDTKGRRHSSSGVRSSYCIQQISGVLIFPRFSFVVTTFSLTKKASSDK